MRRAFHAKLINGPLGDPGLFIQFLLERRAILFDVGDVHNLSVRDILKISHIFISHTHVDHFIGFDGLIRHYVGRDKRISIYGPDGFLNHLEARLKGYSWNLVGEFENDFFIEGIEIKDNRMTRRFYSCKKSFIPEKESEERFSGIIMKNSSFHIEAERFDHRIPCMGFSLKERFHININKEALREMELPVGPWINRFKKSLYEGASRDSDFVVTWEEKGKVVKEKVFNLGDLERRISTITPGTKITYITDIRRTQDNIERAVRFAKGSDHLFIEAVFLYKDREMAKKKGHLTAHDAGLIAREAGVKKLTVFHFSPRYSEDMSRLEKEAMDAFKGKA